MKLIFKFISSVLWGSQLKYNDQRASCYNLESLECRPLFWTWNRYALQISLISIMQTIWLPTSAENWLTTLFILLMYPVVIKYLEKEVQALHKLTSLYVVEPAIVNLYSILLCRDLMWFGFLLWYQWNQVINKTDLAPAVGADLSVMERDALRMRDGGPFVFAQVGLGFSCMLYAS